MDLSYGDFCKTAYAFWGYIISNFRNTVAAVVRPIMSCLDNVTP